MNKMKSLFIVMTLFATSALFAQTSNLRKAKSNYAQFEQLQQAGGAVNQVGSKFLQDALAAIEEASVHEKTKDNPETWTYYALIYGNLAFVEKNSDYASKAVEGIAKAKELDTDGKFAQNLDVALAHIKNHYRQKGAEAWEGQNFKDAYAAFEEGLKLDAQDTTLIYYAGVAAIQNKDYPSAIAKYEQLVPMSDFSEHRTVMFDLPKLIIQEGDTTKALEYATKAVAAYPNDPEISTQNIEYHLMTGHEEKIISEIEAQIAKDPQNKQLYFYLGLARASSENIPGAIEAYKKALEIDPAYTDANLNVAALIMNSANQELMALNDDRSLSNADYNKKVEEIKVKMSAAVPYLENIAKAEPNNRDALRNLKSYYDFVGDEAKSAEIQQKIDAIQ